MSEQHPSATARLQIGVVYALPDRQSVVAVRLPVGATVQDAVNESGLLRKFPEIGQRELVCAIFSRPVELSSALHDGDRVEILRPLLIDPKENRRRSAMQTRKTQARCKTPVRDQTADRNKSAQ